jgi:Tfp pilus assembly protein PilE
MTSTVQKIIIGIVVFVLCGLAVAGVLVGAAVYGWKAAQRAGNEAATIQNVKTIAAVELQYYNTHSKTFGTFDELRKEGMLSSKFSEEQPASDGYVLTLKVTPRTTDLQSSYALNADPQSPNTGKNHFYIDSISGSIHVNEDQQASNSDPPPRE